MTQHRLRIAAIWAISCWPAFNFVSANWETVLRGGISSLLGVILIAVALAVIGHASLLFFRRFRRTDIIVPWTVAVSLFFGYLAIRNGFLFLFDRASLKIPPSAGWFLVAALAFLLAWRWRNIGRLQVAAVMFSLIGGMSAVASLIVTALRIDRENFAGLSAETAIQPGSRGVTGPNVYYILLDGYSGARSLKEDLGFDNSEFMQQMFARGFKDVSRDYSNYLRTQLTLGGIFSLEYPRTDDSRTWRDESRFYPTQFEGGSPPLLIARLQSLGYATWFSASIVAGCPSRHVRCIGSTVAVDGVYMAQAFLTPTPLGRMFTHAFNARRNALEPLGSNIQVMLAEHQPLFVYAHHLAPHPPFSLDRNCNSRYPGTEMLDVWRAHGRDGYIEGLLCVNSQAERLVDQIVAADPSALVILQSDHGSGLLMDWDAPMASWTQDSVEERASYLNLVRSPAECSQWLDRPLGQINTARFVLACAQGRAPEFLPEHTYISTYSLGREQDVVREWQPESE